MRCALTSEVAACTCDSISSEGISTAGAAGAALTAFGGAAGGSRPKLRNTSS
jgi:hypothetical protein